MSSFYPIKIFFGLLMSQSFLLGAPLLAGDRTETFRSLLISPANSVSDQCHNGVLNYRIRKWIQREDAQTYDPFQSVDEIVQSISPVELQQLETKGCNATYFWTFLACTTLDNPDAQHIVTTGRQASTDFEMLNVMRLCIQSLREQSILPYSKS